MPTAKRHTRRIKQMARYLDAVVYSTMYEYDYDNLSTDETKALIHLYHTLEAFVEAKHFEEHLKKMCMGDYD